MRRLLFTLALAIAAVATTAQERRQLTVVIDNVTSRDGRVMVGIYNKEQGAFIQSTRYDGQAKPATVGRMTFVFELPSGSYAIAAYHDQNNNGQLDKNWLGIPKEPYIMSGNRKTIDYAASLIKLDTDRTVTLKL